MNPIPQRPRAPPAGDQKPIDRLLTKRSIPTSIKRRIAYNAKIKCAYPAVITAKFGGLTAEARVRVTPPLPWKFDFSDKKVPITWIGADYRHTPRDVQGESVLVKITTIPKGTRSQTWFGAIDLHDYTIQADLMAGQGAESGKLPDMGVIAQRYTFDLMGESQQLQIRTWPPQLRMAKTMPFTWQANVWYTLKLNASIEDGQAVLRGKIWKRGEAEPQQWTITATDETPNPTGSPGLFGNASNGEIFIDNVVVSKNSRVQARNHQQNSNSKTE